MRGKMRHFDSGATRDTEEDKIDFRGFYDPIVMKAFGEYMTKHRLQADGNLRDSDNWKKGIPLDVYMSSGWRHFFDWYTEHEGYKSREGMVDALCGLLFNVQGYLYEYLKNDTSRKD